MSKLRNCFRYPRFWLTAAAACALFLFIAMPADAVVDTIATVTGKVTDGRNLPVVGAVITARGATTGWTATLADGSFVLRIPTGSYDIIVRKGGYTSGTAAIVATPSAKRLTIALAEANLNSLNVGVAKSSAGVPFNVNASATTVLPSVAIAERPGVTLRDVALELPGLNLAHPSTNVPDTSFVVRGGTIETRVQIDGHAVSAGATARWNSSYASQPLFDSIEVVKGAALAGANAGESAFGTVNLRTREFAGGRHADVVIGADGFGGQYSQFALAGTALPQDRLSYVLEHNVYGYNGPAAGHVVANVVATPNATALLADETPLTAPFMLGSDLAKLRWRLSGNTSLSVGYVGVHGRYDATGGAFGTFLGDRTIVASAPIGQSIGYSSPQYPGLPGTTVPAYTFAHNTTVQTNQPLFEAELRTAIRNDTLLVRPYVATIYNVLDGTGRGSGADPSFGSAWSAKTTGTGCSAQAPCLVPNSSTAVTREQEVDGLHGTTVTLIHPVGDGSLNLSYDYRSDQTSVAEGNPAVRYDGTAFSSAAYLPSIPTTLARNFDWSATFSLPLGARLRAFAGEYYTDWKLHYGNTLNVVNWATGTFSTSTSFADRGYQHNDPHVGLSWRPQLNTSYRFTAGSAITVPYAELVSGGATYADPGTGVGLLALKNPALLPESTVAYNAGVDHRWGEDTVGAIDFFDNTIHNVFATAVAPFNGAILGIPAGSPFSALFATTTMPLNAPIERNYGLELTFNHTPARGLGVYAAATFQRAYLAQLPASFFTARSSLVNGKQLDGSSAIPYAHGYGEVRYHNLSGLGASLGADYTGANNWTNGPAFVVVSSMLRYDLRRGYRAQFSIANLLNRNTGTQYAAGVANGGFADVDYGSVQAGALPTYGATPTTRFAIPPRTFRLQLEAHVGR